MISRGPVVLSAALFLACGPATPPPPSPSVAPAAPPPLPPPERCAGDVPYSEMPAELRKDIYDDFDPPVDPYAEDDPYDPDDPAGAARQAAKNGIKSFKKGDWEDALHHLTDAWGYLKHPFTALWMAEVSAAMGRYANALYYIECVLRAPQAEEAWRERALALKKEALEKVGRLRVAGAPDGACIMVDSLNVGIAPLKEPVYVDAKKHSVQARYGGATWTGEVTVEAKEEKEVRLTGPSSAAGK